MGMIRVNKDKSNAAQGENSEIKCWLTPRFARRRDSYFLIAKHAPRETVVFANIEFHVEEPSLPFPFEPRFRYYFSFIRVKSVEKQIYTIQREK